MTSVKDDPRFKYIAKIVAFQLSNTVTTVTPLMVDKGSNATFINEFFSEGGDGGEPRMALLFYMSKDTVFMTDGTDIALTGRCCYVVRLTPPGTALPADCEMHVNFGTLSAASNPIFTLRALLKDLYSPLLSKNGFGFGKKMTGEHKALLNESTAGFCEQLSKSLEALDMAMTLPKPDEKFEVESKPSAIAAASQDADIVMAYEDVITEWVEITTKLLNEPEDVEDEDDVGPRTELAWWRRRATKLNSIVDDLRLDKCQKVILVLQQCKSRKLKVWRNINNAITDALNEAKDNVKYLSTLDKYIEPLYSATPPAVYECISGLLNNLRMMHAIARHYSTPERMTVLCSKITAQMIANCRKWVTESGSLWEQPTTDLLKSLQMCYDLFNEYRHQYDDTRDKLRENPQAKQFEFQEATIFSKSNLFQRRVEKLIDLFTTVDQFTNLAKHDLEGMEGLMQNFFHMVADFKRKPYDLFDFQVNQFDRDYLEFLANIHELESSLQGFINSSFEHITSTEAAMLLLDQLRHMLQRDSLKDDLESKRLTIFQHFLGDLEVVSRTYEKLKNNPPLVRNVPPVTGNVLWARQLMRRIEAPMQQFRNHQELMELKDSKKAVKVYNKIARTVVEFEALWELAWVRGIEAAKSGLQSTLLVRHPTTEKLYVNFDHQILELMKEAKCLRRLGHEIPESAKMVLMMEDKYKHHYNLLSYALAEYERVMANVPEILAPLLKPHMAELTCVINPGLVTLTWTSMNIQAFLQRFHSEMIRFNELVDKLKDIIANRLVRNQSVIAALPLVEMPDPAAAEESLLPLDKFVGIQERFSSEQTSTLYAKNIEIELALKDLIVQLLEYPLSFVTTSVDPADIASLSEHFSRTTYRAVLDCTRNSLEALKSRVSARSLANFLFIDAPIFEVGVEMTSTGAVMNPTLGEIQSAINSCARAVLDCSKSLGVWENDDGYGAGKKVFDVISRDKDIVRVVLLLTGALEGVKRQVYEYLHTFVKYDYLWKDSKKEAYEKFMAANPSLEDFEAELKKYDLVEQEIMRIPQKHNIGALSLETNPLKTALQKEARTWKKQYAQNLHSQAQSELEATTTWMEQHTRYLKRELNDLDDVRMAMGYLTAIRNKETMLDWEFGPVEEKYALLTRYNVDIPKEESDAVTDLQYSWRKLKTQANEITEQLGAQQMTFKKNLVRNVRMFVVDVAQFRSDFEANGPGVPGLPPLEANERLRKFQRLYDERDRKFEAYSAGETLFGLPVTTYPELEKTKEELGLLSKLYDLFTTVLETINGFNDMHWVDVCGFTETPKGPESNISIMVKKLEEFQLACKKMPKELRAWDAYVELKKMVDDFLETLPLVEQLANPALRPRHWQALIELTGTDLQYTSETFMLKDLLEAGILEVLDDVEEIAGSAVKELAIEGKLNDIANDWIVRSLSFSPFKARGNIILNMGPTMELMEVLEESQMGLGSMLASRFVLPFKEMADQWVEQLSAIGETLEQWTAVQAMWQYLEAVFTSGDIAKQLPQESKRFQGIDKNWVKIMSKGNEVPNVVNYIVGNDVLKQLLPHMIEQLELCQKALSGYLDQKRAAFPRFFFVADATLLEVLSQGSNPQAIQPHLQACFDSVVYAEFNKKDKTKIDMLMSAEGQTMKLVNQVTAEGNIEEWLDRLLKEMQNTVNRIISYAAADSEHMHTEELTHKYQAQVSLIGIQFKWTSDSEEALYRAKAEKGIIKATNKKHQQRLTDLVAINMRPDQEVRAFGAWTRKKVETMIVVDVHQRDVFVDIEIHRVRDVEDFEWQKQARFYWDFDGDVAKISIADVDFSYTCEYLGVKERLVITPLTDRCYVTLSQALGMCLGGAPAGPAGTGKTETTKDMGCTLGKFVMVTNCGDQMDFRSLGGIYKGAAMAGLWSCFDEFNRINLEVLSVAAQQVGSVLMAVKMQAKMFQFTDGQTVNCDPAVGYFITMNPGYAGRQELPENLKSQHRGVTMMVPDRQIIMQVKLTGAGYEQNAICAKKFNVLYKLCEEQLSKQAHYDFGLRNILAVLRTCGSSKRDAGKDPGGTLEPMLVMRTLRDMNLSKFVAEDVPLFLALIDDLFPGLKAPAMKHPLVEPAVLKAVLANNLQTLPTWMLKIIQVYEMCLVRHSLMLVGPSGTGKSRIVQVLQQAFQSIVVPPDQLVEAMIGQPQKFVTMNPKAILSGQMFGTMDVAAGEWNDGIFSQLWRKANKDKKNFTWLVLDGPVDAIWIENMNTVMDDNKLLTLANNDRIPMLRPNVTLHFEVEDLRNASPATVSRAGIIYVSEADLGYMPYVTSWLASRTKDGKDLEPIFTKFTKPFLDFLRIECNSKMSIADISLCTSCTTLIDALLGDLPEPPDAGALERFVLYSMFTTMAGVLESADRAKVDKFLRTLTNNLPECEAPDTVFEFKIDTENPTYPWVAWGALIPGWSFTEEPTQLGKQFASLLIPTIDSVRCEYNMNLSISQNRAVILVGGPGTAKTSIILSVLNAVDPALVTFKKMSFSQATTPSIFQRQIESSVEKRQGKTFGPPNNKKMLCFIDDVSMPLINEWGDQITLEIMRQTIENQGFYNLDKPGEFKGIVDVLILGAMLHPGAGKNDIPNRAKRHFHVMNVTLPSAASINQIFGAMSSSFFGWSQDQAIKDMSQCLVGMTIAIWESIKKKMLPTPAKFHYLFNLRDLSRVFQGIFNIDVQSTLDSSFQLLALWKHECMRVFSDKLVDKKDKAWFAKEIFVVLEPFAAQFGADIEKLQGAANIYFVDFLRDADEDPETGELLAAPKVYEALPFEEFGEAKKKAIEGMGRFNEAYKLLKMELVFFHDALEHLCRITRLFALSRGCALLVGVGGSGKQSLTRLASFICNATFFQIQLTKTYNGNNLLEDFKPLYRRAGVLAKPTIFMLTDKEIKDEGFLEYFNIFLNTGELPNLFPRDELDAIIGECREKYQAMYKGSEPTVDDLWAWFIERVRSHLHLSLCFSPVGVKFSQRALQFPGLINGTTIDWFLTWPEEALTDVATAFIGSFDRLQGDAQVRGKLIKHMAAVHAGMNDACEDFFERYRRKTYVTPKSYLGFIEEYKGVYVRKLEGVQVLADSINTGLDKLREAAADVEKIKIEVREKEKTLIVAQEKGAVMLQEITASTAKAEKKKTEVQAVKDTLGGEAAVIGAFKDEVEKDLLAAKPALDDAENALKAITAKDIGLLKQLKMPPDLVKRVFDVVLLLFQKEVNPPQAETVETKRGSVLQLVGSWNFALPMMADIGFLGALETFNKDAINDETVEMLYPYLAAPDFTPDDARKVASALAGLCTWARAMALYVDIAKVVKPKMENLAQALSKLNTANAKLAKAQGELDQVAAELDEMTNQFNEALATKQALQDDADACNKKMEAANRLIGGLAGERSRWEESSAGFADEIRRLAGDVAQACAFITYVGPYNAEYRKHLQVKLFAADCVAKGVPCTEDLGVSLFLVDAGTIGDWNLEGLPSDELSVENGIMVTRSKKWPLMIDPQSQGMGWIKSREAQNAIKSTQLTDKRFRNHLEDCMAFGNPMIIENVEEEIDPVLDPVLNKEIQRKGRNLIIQLSDKECEYSETFSLVMCTKLTNPHYSPEIFAQLTIINFTVTMGGLEQQLLSRVVQMERPELEEQKKKLVEEVNSNKKVLKGLEDDLLYRLANSTGNLLDDTELIELLSASKVTAVEVNEKLTIAVDTDIRINTAREEYRPSARRGALLYFLIVDMAAINVMYMVSLQQFLELHDFAVNNSEKAPIAAKRIVNIIDYMTNYVTRYMHRGLFERHKKIWTLMLAMKIQQIAGTLSAAYVSNLLKGGGALDAKSEKPAPAKWIPEAVWLNVIALSRCVQMLRDLPDNFERYNDAWQAWYDHDAPETQQFPDYNERLDQFEKMLLVRAVREDRALLAIDTYIAASLGRDYLLVQPLDLAQVHDEATSMVPMITILSTGSDPTGKIQDLARKRKKRVEGISMGQGQEPAARKLLEMGISEGIWVLLQNCHLGLSFMGECMEWVKGLPKLEEGAPGTVLPAFRLWITAEPHPEFPIGMLQLSIKFTNEAPAGIMLGVRNTYTWLNQDMLDSVTDPKWKTMLFALAFMHTIVQERRKFGPLGFNILYEFSQADLSACVTYMQNHLNMMETKRRPVDWITVNYMVCDVQYGGKITDDFDRRLFNTYGKSWLVEKCLASDFKFVAGNDTYYIPPTNPDIDYYRKYIEQLPLVDDPEVFGLHGNADLAYRTAQTKTTLATILDIQPKEGGGGGGLTREEIVLNMVNDLQGKVPPLYNGEATKQGIKALGGLGKPLNICLKQEIDRMQMVLKKLKTVLSDLKLAIAGTIVMSPMLAGALDALFNAKVPDPWAKVMPVSLPLQPNIGVWFANMSNRADQLTNWLKDGRPYCFWLTGMFNPSGFLTASRQEVCRAHSKDNWALDDCVDQFEVLKQERDDVKSGPSEGIYIYGLSLDGARWDKQRNALTDSEPKVRFSPLPVLYVTATGEKRKGGKEIYYQCPIYTCPARAAHGTQLKNYISNAELRSEEHVNKWILRAVCLLTTTD